MIYHIYPMHVQPTSKKMIVEDQGIYIYIYRYTWLKLAIISNSLTQNGSPQPDTSTRKTSWNSWRSGLGIVHDPMVAAGTSSAWTGPFLLVGLIRWFCLLKVLVVWKGPRYPTPRKKPIKNVFFLKQDLILKKLTIRLHWDSMNPNMRVVACSIPLAWMPIIRQGGESWCTKPVENTNNSKTIDHNRPG